MVTIEGVFDVEVARTRLGEIPGVRLLSVEPGKAVLSAGGDGRGAVDLLSRAVDANLDMASISIKPPSLNGLFLTLTGRELRD